MPFEPLNIVRVFLARVNGLEIMLQLGDPIADRPQVALVGKREEVAQQPAGSAFAALFLVSGGDAVEVQPHVAVPPLLVVAGEVAFGMKIEESLRADPRLEPFQLIGA